MLRYRLTPEDYESLRAHQDGRCHICGEERPLDVDHDHETGRVRGLLCRACNLGIGKLKDDPDLVEAAASYLRRGGE